MITLMRFVNFVVVMGLAALPVWQLLEPKCFAQVWEQARGQTLRDRAKFFISQTHSFHLLLD
ncbi:hypothetical protein FACS1894107_16430 [Planctomycetales bacterium]|nr:hypothetical protein FACS1894107_16430 [Planctomycetales bacterium]